MLTVPFMSKENLNMGCNEGKSFDCNQMIVTLDVDSKDYNPTKCRINFACHCKGKYHPGKNPTCKKCAIMCRNANNGVTTNDEGKKEQKCAVASKFWGTKKSCAKAGSIGADEKCVAFCEGRATRFEPAPRWHDPFYPCWAVLRHACAWRVLLTAGTITIRMGSSRGPSELVSIKTLIEKTQSRVFSKGVQAGYGAHRQAVIAT